LIGNGIAVFYRLGAGRAGIVWRIPVSERREFPVYASIARMARFRFRWKVKPSLR